MKELLGGALTLLGMMFAVEVVVNDTWLGFAILAGICWSIGYSITISAIVDKVKEKC